MHFTYVLSIELDSVLMEKRKPKDKLVKARHLIQSQKQSETFQLQQSIIGLFNFACSVVILGSPSSRRLIDLSVRLT